MRAGPEKAVGRLLHEHEIVQVSSNAAKNTENMLNKEGRSHQPAIDEMCQIVKVADIVALVLQTWCRDRPCSRGCRQCHERYYGRYTRQNSSHRLLPMNASTSRSGVRR